MTQQGLLHAVIVGYGRAGFIHGKVYDRLKDVCVLSAVVDPDPEKRDEATANLPGMAVYPSLPEALTELGPDIILDFCVPAKINLDLVNTALRLGVRKFMIEKPLGWDVANTQKLVQILNGCDVAYLDTYAASSGLRSLLKRVREEGSDVRTVDIRFHKNRISDSLSRRGFMQDAVPSAWMIEGPHMLSIARQIAGDVERVLSADTFDMNIGPGHVLSDHGGGRAVLAHQGNVVTHLDLSLCSAENQRTVEVCLNNDVRLVLELPPSKQAEQYSTLEVQYPSGRCGREQFPDRPMEHCVFNAVRRFAGEARVVSPLVDGLDVCTMIEKMTEKQRFWQSVPKQWKNFGPPLRPCAEDIRVMEDQVERWRRESSSKSCDVLLCGVTPEIVQMQWPENTSFWAVEKSQAMIDEVWPAGQDSWKQVVLAEWTRLPFGPNSFDIVIGDGCLTSLEYPAQQRVFLESVQAVLRPGGRLIMRFFVQRDQPERPQDVFRDLSEGRIGSFHVFKWRLAMSLQTAAEDGIKVDDIWKTWREAGVETPWPPQTVQTIDTYRDSQHRLTFTRAGEIHSLFAEDFEQLAWLEQDYELSERCPILVYAQRHSLA